MNDLISRQAAIEELKKTIAVNRNPNHDARVWEEGMNSACSIIGSLPSAQRELTDNKVNLCDTCAHTYPGCPSKDVIFGNGVGNDNICACNEYCVKGWVSVEERLPDAKSEYIVTVYDRGHVVKTDMFVDGGWWTYGTDVVAWMPIPEPYRG